MTGAAPTDPGRQDFDEFNATLETARHDGELYWTRFNIFSAIAGALVVAWAATDAKAGKLALTVAGAVGAVAWLVIGSRAAAYYSRHMHAVSRLARKQHISPFYRGLTKQNLRRSLAFYRTRPKKDGGGLEERPLRRANILMSWIARWPMTWTGVAFSIISLFVWAVLGTYTLVFYEEAPSMAPDSRPVVVNVSPAAGSSWGEMIAGGSFLIAAVSFAWGVSAWKREFVGKRRIDLAESVLALFYEVEETLRAVRSSFGWVGEGRTRKRAENEDKRESETLDRAFVAVERLRQHEKLFAELRSMKYRMMTAFGPRAASPFEEVHGILNQIVLASDMLRYYWRRQGEEMSEPELKKHVDEMHKHEGVIWESIGEPDPIRQRVQNAVEAIEALVKEANEQRTRTLYFRPKTVG